MKKVRVVAIVVTILSLISCTSSRNIIDLNVSDEYEGFKPVRELRLVPHAVVFDEDKEQRIKKDWALLSREERLRNLSLMESEVSIFQVDSSGGLTYISSSATRKKGRYLVMIDFSRYRTEEVHNDGDLIGIAKVGVGLRLIADISTKSSGLNLSGVMPLAFAFDKKQVQGRISAQTIGVVAEDISKYFVTQTDLDRTSISKAIESFGSIRVIMDDVETEFEPYLLAISLVAPMQEQEIIRRTTE